MHGDDEATQKLELAVSRMCPREGGQLPPGFPMPALATCLAGSSLEPVESGKTWRNKVIPSHLFLFYTPDQGLFGHLLTDKQFSVPFHSRYTHT